MRQHKRPSDGKLWHTAAKDGVIAHETAKKCHLSYQQQCNGKRLMFKEGVPKCEKHKPI